jgi:hypothetical protein
VGTAARAWDSSCMTRTERNSLRVLMGFVALGWLGQIVGAIIHGGIGTTTYGWFARACWLAVTIFVAVKYVNGTREGLSDE